MKNSGIKNRIDQIRDTLGLVRFNVDDRKA